MTEGGLTSTPHNLQDEVAVLTKPTYKGYPEETGLHVATHEFQKMHEPKISKLKGACTSSARLVFQYWLKDIHVHVQDRRLMQREAIQLVKDFTTECAWDEMEFYMGMVAEDQSFEGLTDHLHNAFQSGETLSKLINDLHGWSQKAHLTKDTVTDDLQVLARKIIVHKASFCLKANNQLKTQYAHITGSILCGHGPSALQFSPEKETFTRFLGYLVTMFRGHARQSKSSVTSKGTDSEVNQISGLENKLSRNYRQCQNKINMQEAQINSLQNQNTQLKGPLPT